MTSSLLHGTCVSIGGRGVLLLGKPGSGKSDLALRLIDRGAVLISDDQTLLVSANRTLMLSPPDTLQGLLELHGIGIFQMSYEKNIPLALAVQLVEREAVERMPEEAFFDCLGIKVPLLSLHAFDNSTEAKIRLFLQTI